MTRMLFGVITAARPPEDPLNVNKHQYEYDVDVDADVGTKVPVRHVILKDEFGSLDESEDTVLRPGNRVVVLFPDDRLNNGVIVCGLRNRSKKMSRDLGPHNSRRYNKVTQTVDKDGHWTLQLDQGEFIKVDKQKITISNSTGEELVFDKGAKSILVKAGKDWKTTLGGSMQVDATENVLINCKTATVNASNSVSIKTKKFDVQCDEALIKASKKFTVESTEIKMTGSKQAQLDGGEVLLGKGTGQVVTILTMPLVDNITGQPSIGLPKIRAG